MRCYRADLVAAALLAIDYIPHGLSADRADDLVVDDHRKDVVSVDPASARSPSRKRATALEDRCGEIEEAIMPSAIGMANEAEVIVHCRAPSVVRSTTNQAQFISVL